MLQLKPKKLVHAALMPQKKLLAGLRYALHGWFGKPVKAAPLKAIRGARAQDDEFRQLSFTFAVIALSARLARIDGPLTQDKYIAFRESFPLKTGVCAKIRELFVLACDDETPFEHYVKQIKYTFPRRTELFHSLLERLFRIAAADGSISRAEETMLARVAHLLDISAPDFAHIRMRYEQPLKPHEVLGVHKHMQGRQLKKRYHELMQRYHPDRYASDDLSPELALMLKLKASEINKAYRALSKRAA